MIYLIVLLYVNVLGVSSAFTISGNSIVFATRIEIFGFSGRKNNENTSLFTHTQTVSPYQNASYDNRDEKKTETSLEELCSYLKVTPANLLYLSSQSGDGERGVFLNSSVRKDDILLNIPLSSCIRDDEPPLWYDNYKSSHRNEDFDDDNFHYNPNKWPARLAASLLDLQIRADIEGQNNSSDLNKGLYKWLSMMPDEALLRASLPIHWPEDIVAQAKCTALELSIDASYFARAEAMADLKAAVKMKSNHIEWKENKLEEHDVSKMAESIFDIVQTRSCRAERLDGIQLRPSLRVLAPIFDFINHGSRRHDGIGSANAYFGLEEVDDGDLSLVVRARNDIDANEEVLIDYGDSARPAWRCLASYGFVPNYRLTSPDDELDEGEEDESVAEIFMDGTRYEVGSHTVPYEMVEAASIALLEENQGPEVLDDSIGDGNENPSVNLLTPEVALRIAKRVSDASFQLLLDPAGNEERNHHGSILIAKQLSGALRWSQHKVLLNCAIGLRDYAGR